MWQPPVKYETNLIKWLISPKFQTSGFRMVDFEQSAALPSFMLEDTPVWLNVSQSDFI